MRRLLAARIGFPHSPLSVATSIFIRPSDVPTEAANPEQRLATLLFVEMKALRIILGGECLIASAVKV
jgi:hypothetical protein